MTGTPQYVDISAFQPVNIDWHAYRAWAAQWDGIARVAMRSSYGVGYPDMHFAAYRQGALEAGIDVIMYYHYAYPEYNQATAEADYQHAAVGAIRPNDVLMLDYEEEAAQANAEWAYEWLARQEANYGGKLPTLYASDAYIRQRLQDSRLARYPLTLANWQFTPDERPACPPPWTSYTYLQYTDRAVNIPGIAGAVDADIYLGKEPTAMTLPSNWHLSADGQTLYCKNIDPNKPDVPVQFGFKDYVLPRLQSGAWLNEDVFLGPQGYKEQLEYSDADLGDGDQIVSLFGRMLCYPHNPKGAVAHLKGQVVLEYTGIELQRWKDQFLKLYALYQADEEKLKQQPSGDLVQRLSLISGLVQQAGPILQQIGTAATVK